jgi:hypothetical protein
VPEPVPHRIPLFVGSVDTCRDAEVLHGRRPARRGHPLGATGVAQVVEVTRHLAGRTGSPGHRRDAGLTHCTGGGISGYDHAVCTIHILPAA